MAADIKTAAPATSADQTPAAKVSNHGRDSWVWQHMFLLTTLPLANFQTSRWRWGALAVVLLVGAVAGAVLATTKPWAAAPEEEYVWYAAIDGCRHKGLIIYMHTIGTSTVWGC